MQYRHYETDDHNKNELSFPKSLKSLLFSSQLSRKAYGAILHLNKSLWSIIYRSHLEPLSLIKVIHYSLKTISVIVEIIGKILRPLKDLRGSQLNIFHGQESRGAPRELLDKSSHE